MIVSQTDKGIAPLPFIGGQPLTPALWPFGRSVQDTVGEDRSWCFRGPSLHRHRALESPFRAKFAPCMRYACSAPPDVWSPGKPACGTDPRCLARCASNLKIGYWNLVASWSECRPNTRPVVSASDAGLFHIQSLASPFCPTGGSLVLDDLDL
jgi:hypothetical protein